MAKYERDFLGNYDQYVEKMSDYILRTSSSSHLEAATSYRVNDVRISIRVFERYSYTGGNRVSLSVTVIGHGPSIHVCGIASGGSQGLFFKVNTLGEEAFLNQLIDFTEDYMRNGE